MWTDKRIIYDITPFSLLDYPDVASCILWFAGCNMRCSYCYNPDIVSGKGKSSLADALAFIRSRRGLLDGVVLSGGECTMYKEIIPLARAVKEIGMLVKIDTNGSHPSRMRELLEQGLADYVSLDFKAMPDRFEAITGSSLYAGFGQTFDLLLQSGLPFEVRTTVHSALLPEEELRKMAGYLAARGYRETYYLQNFMDGTKTIHPIPQKHKRLETLQLPGDTIDVVIRN